MSQFKEGVLFDKPVDPPKVVIPREVARAIESIRNRDEQSRTPDVLLFTNWVIMAKRFPDEHPVLLNYFQMNAKTYIAAIEDGYDLPPQTTDEKLLEYYQQKVTLSTKETIRFVLDTIGRTVRGINDKEE